MASDPDEAALLQGLFPPDALLQLLDLCGTAVSRKLVMHIAQAVPSAEASISVQARYIDVMPICHAVPMMLCHAMPRYAMPYGTMLCDAMLCYVVPCCDILSYTVSCSFDMR